jgi:hypothetical protein
MSSSRSLGANVRKLRAKRERGGVGQKLDGAGTDARKKGEWEVNIEREKWLQSATNATKEGKCDVKQVVAD